ncbi:LytR/AlgR family response regulator transcription factor [Larkinella humicola]|uniref:Response regulator transcription factor n=1 Tax=Larkinella humicola TaxID=2607654 RepID=A0A5N1J714_9BACT|nr:LytTR family DNA-binding domain-containing protein [Larkinella humicola]KAA9346488.1 response regulator transcription factor [Larkinella humicola]
MNPYHTLIIDDELAAREVIRTLLADTPLLRVVDEAANGLEAVQKILLHRPHLIFLDIQMPRLDGFSVLRKVWPDHQPTVVFTTAYDQYALQAFEVNAIDYLLKPFDEIRFGQALGRAIERLNNQNQPKIEALLAQLLSAHTPAPPREYLSRVLVKEQGRMYFVNLNDVQYLDADGNYITLHTATGKHIVYDSLTKLETRLDPNQFVRMHRSHIVNLAYVQEVETHFNGDYIVHLKLGQTLKWTRNYRDKIQAFLG